MEVRFADSVKEEVKTSTRTFIKNAPLTEQEHMFLRAYIRDGDTAKAVVEAGICDEDEKQKTKVYVGNRLLKQPNIIAKIKEIIERMDADTIMSTQEVMEYFTAVARGQIKDQFGLDAPLTERTRAAIEVAKRTIDLENKTNANDNQIHITLDWKRDENE